MSFDKVARSGRFPIFFIIIAFVRLSSDMCARVIVEDAIGGDGKVNCLI